MFALLGARQEKCLYKKSFAIQTVHKNTDQTRSLLLAEIALDVAINLLNINGNFCCKLIRGRGEEELVTTMRQYFKEIKRYKPKSSRKESAEIFIIGLNFMHQGLA